MSSPDDVTIESKRINYAGGRLRRGRLLAIIAVVVGVTLTVAAAVLWYVSASRYYAFEYAVSPNASITTDASRRAVQLAFYRSAAGDRFSHWTSLPPSAPVISPLLLMGYKRFDLTTAINGPPVLATMWVVAVDDLVPAVLGVALTLFGGRSYLRRGR